MNLMFMFTTKHKDQMKFLVVNRSRLWLNEIIFMNLSPIYTKMMLSGSFLRIVSF